MQPASNKTRAYAPPKSAYDQFWQDLSRLLIKMLPFL
jgi:hypothetical protein